MEQQPKPTFQDVMTERLKVMSGREELEKLNQEKPCLDGSIDEHVDDNRE